MNQLGSSVVKKAPLMRCFFYRVSFYFSIKTEITVVNTAKEMRIPELGGFNQRRFVDETSRNLMGTGILAGTIAAARNGLTTGGYSEDPDEAQAQRNAGMLECENA